MSSSFLCLAVLGAHPVWMYLEGSSSCVDDLTCQLLCLFEHWCVMLQWTTLVKQFCATILGRKTSSQTMPHHLLDCCFVWAAAIVCIVNQSDGTLSTGGLGVGVMDLGFIVWLKGLLVIILYCSYFIGNMSCQLLLLHKT